jgi:hypothetical protein
MDFSAAFAVMSILLGLTTEQANQCWARVVSNPPAQHWQGIRMDLEYAFRDYLPPSVV